ncbi:hypothetical protein BBN63_17660 [Streptomyces niveus]|uniref:Erythromycin biosynthesis protein CIII-like central domain-containing protein n=2 Tax=Streptomyces niveus TaxID=193462 RepID=A0A1U9QVW3_STRNV|nr:hypothetical protein BBN63_17660 [Streptomyces niveus]
MADDMAATGAAGPRLLLNAQPFGFGPPAATAALARELAPLCGELAYFGGGHTLDLQHRPPYHAVYGTTGLSDGERLAWLRRLAPRYDLFVTAMDFEEAALARRAGLDVAVYDALTWFWPEIPAVAGDAALYIAQDFFGVRERIAADPALRRNSVIVPPIVPRLPARQVWRPERPGDGRRRHVLLNLGGLQNPYWEPSDAAAYARLMLDAVQAAQPAGRSVVVTTSRGVTAALGAPKAQTDARRDVRADVPTDIRTDVPTDIRTDDRDTVLDLMSGAAYACMTPGLGNIYDAAATGVPTLWLPSANETHHLQARLLSEHGFCDARLDWPDVGGPADYDVPASSPSAVPEALTRAIVAVIHRLSDPRGLSGLRDRLADAVAKSTAGLGLAPGRAQALTERFGHGGTEEAATALVRWAGANSRRPPH